MLQFEINNGRVMELAQQSVNRAVRVDVYGGSELESTFSIPAGDVVMLLNYYKHVKDSDIQNDFINPNGKTIF